MTPLIPKREEKNISESYSQDELVFDMLANQKYDTAKIIGITTKKFLLSFIPAFLIEIANSYNVILFFKERSLVFVKEGERRDKFVSEKASKKKETQDATKRMGIRLESYHNSVILNEIENGENKEKSSLEGKEKNLNEFPLASEYYLAMGIWGRRYVANIIKKDVYTNFDSYLGNFFLTGYDWIIIFGKEEKKGYRTENQVIQVKERMTKVLQLQENPKFEEQLFHTREIRKNNIEIIELIARIVEKFRINENYIYERKKWTLNEITREDAGELLKGRKKEKEVKWLMGRPIYVQGNIILFKQDEHILLIDSNDLLEKEYLTMEM